MKSEQKKMEEYFISLEKVSVHLGGQVILKDISFRVGSNEQLVVTGPSGSGKTVLAQILSGQLFYSGKIRVSFGTAADLYHSVVLLEQQHRFKDISNQSNFYYQQRYNSDDAVKTLTVREELTLLLSGMENAGNELEMRTMMQLLKIDHLLDKPLIQLSNGENKRLQFVKALLREPRLLILDQPFFGLDPEGRESLKTLLNHLHSRGLKLLLICSLQEIPECFTHIAVLEKGCLTQYSSKADFAGFHSPVTSILNPKNRLRELRKSENEDFEFAVRMLDTTVRYGGKEILSHVNWEVPKGDKCCIMGPNGAGKSTLLSLISGDNPQAYANEIYLFDRRRGTGESIWDIKKKIGFISPEMHLYFDRSATCLDTVGSGFFDTIGLFRRLTDLEQEQVILWLDIFGLKPKMHQSLYQLPAGEQRQLLLARALIKKPPLLLLDEPCQGLDDDQTCYFKSLIDEYCEIFNSTLIYVSHSLLNVPGSIHRFLKMEDGRMLE